MLQEITAGQQRMMIAEQDTKGVPRELDEVSVRIEDAQDGPILKGSRGHLQENGWAASRGRYGQKRSVEVVGRSAAPVAVAA